MPENIKFNPSSRRAFNRQLERAVSDATLAAGVVYLRQLRKNISVSVRAGVNPELVGKVESVIPSSIPDEVSKAGRVKREKKVDSTKNPSGRSRRRSRGIEITRSNPGEYPRRETGNLLKSWNEQNIKRHPDGSTEIFSDSRAFPYNIDLETGTRHMKPRPYIVKTFKETERRMQSAAILAMNKRLN